MAQVGCITVGRGIDPAAVDRLMAHREVAEWLTWCSDLYRVVRLKDGQYRVIEQGSILGHPYRWRHIVSVSGDDIEELTAQCTCRRIAEIRDYWAEYGLHACEHALLVWVLTGGEHRLQELARLFEKMGTFDEFVCRYK